MHWEGGMEGQGEGKTDIKYKQLFKNLASAHSFPIRLWARLEDSFSKTQELTVQIALIW
jgi:hypothetical protein